MKTPRKARRVLLAIHGGTKELTRNPGNFFAVVERAAFNPANIVTIHRHSGRPY